MELDSLTLMQSCAMMRKLKNYKRLEEMFEMLWGEEWVKEGQWFERTELDTKNWKRVEILWGNCKELKKSREH